MRLQNVKLLTAMMLSGLISAVAVFPAFARPVGELKSDQLLSQTNQDSINQSPTNQDSTNQTPMNRDSTNQMDRAVTGEIVTIDGERVTIRQSDGQTRQIMIPQRDMQRLNLRPGMRIAATLDDQNMASSVSMANTNTASENTTDASRTTSTLRREEEITQRRTVETRPAPTSTENTDIRSTEVRQAQEVEPQTEEPRPVRALW